MEEQGTTSGKEDACRDVSVSSPKGRLRLWEIDRIFKCPVAGLCLTVAEQRHLLKKAYMSEKNKKAHDIHEILVSFANNENRLSRRMDNLLNLKFGKEASLFLGLDDNEFMERFNAAVLSGNIAGALWAAAVRPGLPGHFKTEVFGEVHMALFFNIEKVAAMRKEMERLEGEVNAMARAAREATGHRRTLHKENEHLKQSLAELNVRMSLMEKERSMQKGLDPGSRKGVRVEDIEKENESLRAELAARDKRLKNETNRVEYLKEKNSQLLSELKYERDLHRQISEETRDIIRDTIARNGCDETCPSFDLCRKRILMVGGITRMETRYKELVESKGGVFEYHHGYMKKGVRDLESRLKRADLVICPVNCNSHAACLTVKTLAKKHNKTLHMLANSSLSAVSQAISGNGCRRGRVN